MPCQQCYCTNAPWCRCTALDREWVVWKVEVDGSKGGIIDQSAICCSCLSSRSDFPSFGEHQKCCWWNSELGIIDQRAICSNAAQSWDPDRIFQVLGLIVFGPKNQLLGCVPKASVANNWLCQQSALCSDNWGSCQGKVFWLLRPLLWSMLTKCYVLWWLVPSPWQLKVGTPLQVKGSCCSISRFFIFWGL